MGDAAGIGPEILVKALTHESVYSLCQPIAIGSSAILQDACFRFTASNKPPLKLNIIKTPMQALARHGTIDVLDVSSISPQDISVGTIDARAGAAAVKAIEIGTHLTMHGDWMPSQLPRSAKPLYTAQEFPIQDTRKCLPPLRTLRTR